jgi:gluconate 2-dehydrogenase gamma chain
MSDPALTRRTFLAASGTALATVWLAANPTALRASGAHAAMARDAAPPVPWLCLTPEEAADLEAIAAQIIPTDDLPGAREAGAVYFMDHSFATWAKDQLAALRSGLDDLNRAGRFATLSSDQQTALLRTVEQTPFFQMVRFATVAGTFANPSWGGNRDKVGWRILGFEDRFVWQPPFGDYDADAGAHR